MDVFFAPSRRGNNRAAVSWAHRLMLIDAAAPPYCATKNWLIYIGEPLNARLAEDVQEVQTEIYLRTRPSLPRGFVDVSVRNVSSHYSFSGILRIVEVTKYGTTGEDDVRGWKVIRSLFAAYDVAP